MKGLFIIIGESFRLGGQGTRIRGVNESYKEQINACNTHILFFNHLKNKFNCESSVYISTYNTLYNNSLIDIYKDYLLGYKMYDDLIGLTQLFRNSVINNKNNINNFDFIFYFRIDLFLKNKFIELFNPLWDTIYFPTICWIKYNIYNGKPRVNDMMLFIPKRLFEHLDNIVICHEAWYIFTNELHIKNKDLNVMIDTYHDSDSEKDFNPLYYIVNRPENQEWYSKNEKFVKEIIESFTLFKKKNKNKIYITIILMCIIVIIYSRTK